jgi:cellulose synthase/poly-beta-1,6-N-acetylglucosamine synthase-like glycosyltransferase
MYLLYFQEAFRQLDLSGHLRNYFYLFNYFFAYYGIALNSIYLALLAFSFYGSRKQMRYWNMKNSGLLFKKGLLPSISIIAPAFREESTIIESVNSLINLKYPITRL